MKRLLLAVLLFLLPAVGWAETQTHATDCTTLTCDAARIGQTCYEIDADAFYVCDSDVPEWVLIATAVALLEDTVEAFIFDADAESIVGVWEWQDGIAAVFGNDADASIQHNNSNFLITNTTGNILIDPGGFTDFTNGIFVAEGETSFSRFGGDPTGLNPSDAQDTLVARMVRSTTGSGTRRSGLFVMDLDWTGTNAGGLNMGVNGFVYTNVTTDAGNTKTTAFGGGVGGRYAFRHLSSGLFSMAGGLSSTAAIIGADEDGTITDAYAFLDEGGMGGAGGGEISEYRGLWILPSIGNVLVKTGIHIEDLNNAIASTAILIEGQTGGPAISFHSDVVGPFNGLNWGLTADTNLYRSAANTLKTDDSLIISQGLSVDVETVTATSATLGIDDYIMLIDDDTAGSTVTITLPVAAPQTGRVYHIKKLGTTANVIIDGNASETIDGGLTATLTIQYESIQIVSDGSNWSII